ncbi:MAG: hypothetical protein MZV70_57110 [Desulfobacterales bacterium]|nr:hypothetical protein [Desulfobacterales bacterium]
MPYLAPTKKLALTMPGIIAIPSAFWRRMDGMAVWGDAMVFENVKQRILKPEG